MIVIYVGNYWYGHTKILAEYCGLASGRPPRIRGHVQHGWNSFDGFSPVAQTNYWADPLVWSNTVARRGVGMGRRRYRVIGAPWSYLLNVKGVTDPESWPNEREGTLYLPFHGWELQDIGGSHGDLVDDIRSVEGDSPVTVCLYWKEYEDLEVRRIYEDAGFRVVCNGHRGISGNDWDNDFLYVQLSELLKHRRVASNRVATALLYGASVGCEVAVYGDPMELEGARTETGRPDRILAMWPELDSTAVDMNFSAAWARTELGLDALLNPEELREVLGWTAVDLRQGTEIQEPLTIDLLGTEG